MVLEMGQQAINYDFVGVGKPKEMESSFSLSDLFHNSHAKREGDEIKYPAIYSTTDKLTLFGLSDDISDVLTGENGKDTWDVASMVGVPDPLVHPVAQLITYMDGTWRHESMDPLVYLDGLHNLALLWYLATDKEMAYSPNDLLAKVQENVKIRLNDEPGFRGLAIADNLRNGDGYSVLFNGLNGNDNFHSSMAYYGQAIVEDHVYHVVAVECRRTEQDADFNIMLANQNSTAVEIGIETLTGDHLKIFSQICGYIPEKYHGKPIAEMMPGQHFNGVRRV